MKVTTLGIIFGLLAALFIGNVQQRDNAGLLVMSIRR